MNRPEAISQFEAELSSLETAVEEITERITKIGDALAMQKLDGHAHDLYQAERHLRSATRAISKVRR